MPGYFASIWDNPKGLSAAEHTVLFKSSSWNATGRWLRWFVWTWVGVAHYGLRFVRPTRSLSRISNTLSKDRGPPFRIRHERARGTSKHGNPCQAALSYWHCPVAHSRGLVGDVSKPGNWGRERPVEKEGSHHIGKEMDLDHQEEIKWLLTRQQQEEYT